MYQLEYCKSLQSRKVHSIKRIPKWFCKLHDCSLGFYSGLIRLPRCLGGWPGHRVILIQLVTLVLEQQTALLNKFRSCWVLSRQ
jgi:hypothetical protein